METISGSVTYSEEEIQKNKINENNASLIMYADFYCIYNSQLEMDTTLAEDRILGFLYYRTKNGKFIYVKNEDLMKLIKGSEATVTRTLKSLVEKGLIEMPIKRIVGGGTDRKLRLDHRAIILMSPKHQIDESETSNGGVIKEYNKKNKKEISNKLIDRLKKEGFTDELIQTILDFDATKKKGKISEMKEQYLNKRINELKKLGNNEQQKMIKVVEQSIMKGRTGLFPIPNEQQGIVIGEKAPDGHIYTEKDKPGSGYYRDDKYKIYRKGEK